MVGDDDEIRIEHTVALHRGLADAQLAVVPGTSHGLLVEKPALCNAMILEFLGVHYAQTVVAGATAPAGARARTGSCRAAVLRERPGRS